MKPVRDASETEVHVQIISKPTLKRPHSSEDEPVTKKRLGGTEPPSLNYAPQSADSLVEPVVSLPQAPYARKRPVIITLCSDRKTSLGSDRIKHVMESTEPILPVDLAQRVYSQEESGDVTKQVEQFIAESISNIAEDEGISSEHLAQSMDHAATQTSNLECSSLLSKLTHEQYTPPGRTINIALSGHAQGRNMSFKYV